jgi:nitrous oxidase accessory protein NosD
VNNQTSYASLRINEVTGAVIRNNTLNNSFSEITATYTNDTVFEKNAINGPRTGYGIVMQWDCWNNTVVDNAITDKTSGIYLIGANATHVIRGTITGCNNGIMLNQSNNTLINDTVITFSTTGIADRFGNFTRVNGTAIHDNNQGILSQFSFGGMYTWNTVRDNWINVLAYKSANDTFYFNTFVNNSTATNVISNTTLEHWNSTTNVSYTYNGQPYTGKAGNWWSDYAGYDDNNNGIGDSPYACKNATDYYPLVQTSVYSPSLISMQYTKVSQPENMRAQVWVNRSGTVTTTCSVQYTCTDTAQNGVSYIAVSGVLDFAPGETRKAIWINLIDNTRRDSDRTFTVTLSNPVGATLGRTVTVCTIKDNDPLGG